MMLFFFFFLFTTAPTPQAPHPLSDVTPTLALTSPSSRPRPQTCDPLSLSLAPSVPSRLLTQREEPHTHTHKNRSAIRYCHCWWRRALWCMHTVRVKEWKIKTNVLNLFCMTSVGLPSWTGFFFCKGDRCVGVKVKLNGFFPQECLWCSLFGWNVRQELSPLCGCTCWFLFEDRGKDILREWTCLRVLVASHRCSNEVLQCASVLHFQRDQWDAVYG